MVGVQNEVKGPARVGKRALDRPDFRRIDDGGDPGFRVTYQVAIIVLQAWKHIYLQR